jgi:hypothetical protein
VDSERVSVNLLEGFDGVFSDAEAGAVPDQKLWRQNNVMSVRQGELTTRGGLVLIEFDVLE